MNKKLKTYIAEKLKTFGLYNPVRKFYNWITLLNSRKNIQISNLEAVFFTPSYRIIEDLENIFCEKDFLGYLLKEVQENDVVWDVGASYGIYSVFFGKIAKSGKVYAFEPEASTCKLLEKNIKLNELKNIFIQKYALGDTNEKILFYQSKSANIGTHSILKRSDYPVSSKGKLIQVKTADAIIKNKDVFLPDVIKIDVEGAEMMVLNGMKSLLREGNIRILQIEIHPKLLNLMNVKEEDVKNFIESFGYIPVKCKTRGTEVLVLYKKV